MIHMNGRLLRQFQPGSFNTSESPGDLLADKGRGNIGDNGPWQQEDDPEPADSQYEGDGDENEVEYDSDELEQLAMVKC